MLRYDFNLPPIDAIHEPAANNPPLLKRELTSVNRVKRILLIILGVIVVLIVVMAASFVTISRSPFPDTEGEKMLSLPDACKSTDAGSMRPICESLTGNGLQSPVHVYRDGHGIPHIYAESAEDLFFAQGYVHAQDRMWQMEFWRHIAHGRVSEIIGQPGVENDVFIRTSGWNRIAEATTAYYEQELPEAFSYLEAYSAGVNAYLAENKDNIAISQRVLGLVGEPWEIEPWKPIDSIGWGVVMAWDLDHNWNRERTRARLYATIGEGTTDELIPGFLYATRPVIAPTSELAIGGMRQTAASPSPAIDWSAVATTLIGRPPETLGSGPFLGSNNWVIGGEHTESGLPLLANDPHLGIQMPAIWYQVGLHAPGWEVAGFSFAGAPGVIIGHNERIAWGVTNLPSDVQDLFIEKINPDNPNQYEFMGEWLDADVFEEVIKVNGGEDIVVTVRETLHGPIISDALDDESLTDVLAMRWTAAAEPARLFQAVLLLNQARDFPEFQEALRYWDVAAQNFVYADVDGNIGYQATGLVPVRKNGNGMVPVPGWTGEYEWEGYIPYEEMPALLNPEQGFIVTANHASVDEQFPYFIARDWSSGDRAQRITDMITEVSDQRKITIDDIAVMHMDSYSLRAASFVPLLAGLSSDDADVSRALDYLRQWDYQERRDSVAATLFEIFYMQMVSNVLADDVGPENVSDVHQAHFFHQLAVDPGAPWWDNISTPETETRETILLRSLEDAIAWLNQNRGGDMADWTWGSLHQATFVSNPLGASGIGPIESLVNRGPFPADGGSDLVNANSWQWSNPAAITSHASGRIIIDMSDFDSSLAVIPTGQSGHPYNKHYDDMIEMWLNGQYHPMAFSREAVDAAAEDHLILQPER